MSEIAPLKPKVKISIQRALTTLKTIDVKIQSKIADIKAATTLLPGAKIQGLYSPEKFKENCANNMKSYIDLKTMRDSLKSKIYASNSVTQVIVSGQTMTVAEAIVKKEGLPFEIQLNESLRRQILTATAKVASDTDVAKVKAEPLMVQLLGKDAKKDSSEGLDFINNYVKTNVPEVILAIDEEELKKMIETTQAFKDDVDTSLSESNALTMIEL